jgi:glycosyltransferase involved in cell wall biosynthesis
MPIGPFFTICTPTYNRAHTLERTFRSLQYQTFKNFEWLVIDDGSADSTEYLMRRLSVINGLAFPINYYQVQHRGKHIALNIGADLARGFMFGVLDSDDELTPRALERINTAWDCTQNKERYSGVGGLCGLGPRLPYAATPADMIFKYNIRCERWGVTKTDIIRQYPFPEVGGQYVPEGLQDLQTSKYERRYINEPLRKYHPSNDGLNGSLTKGAPGRLYYYSWLLKNELRYFRYSPMTFIKAALAIPLFWVLSKC